MTRAGGAALLAALAAAGCVKHVLPDANTGEDGEYDGADGLALDPATHRGSTDGTVSYPGGDRVDWVQIPLPVGTKGTLSFELSWRSPRAGGDLAFKVYDEWGRDLGGAKPKKASAARRSKKKRGEKSATVGPTQGTVYVEIYASNVWDAGDYELAVKYEETYVPPPVEAVDIPLPPRLALVPPPCTKDNYDPTNPECTDQQKPCDLSNPDPKNPNCPVAAPVKCTPTALDPANPDCLQYYKACDPKHIDVANPKCAGVPPEPVPAAVLATNPGANDKETLVTLDLGSDDGVDLTWTGYLVDSNEAKVSGGGLTLTKVKAKSCTARVAMKKALAEKYHAARLVAPPPVPAPPAEPSGE